MVTTRGEMESRFEEMERAREEDRRRIETVLETVQQLPTLMQSVQQLQESVNTLQGTQGAIRRNPHYMPDSYGGSYHHPRRHSGRSNSGQFKRSEPYRRHDKHDFLDSRDDAIKGQMGELIKSMDNILQTVRKLRNSFQSFQGIPEVLQEPHNTVKEINRCDFQDFGRDPGRVSGYAGHDGSYGSYQTGQKHYQGSYGAYRDQINDSECHGGYWCDRFDNPGHQTGYDQWDNSVRTTYWEYDNYWTDKDRIEGRECQDSYRFYGDIIEENTEGSNDDDEQNFSEAVIKPEMDYVRNQEPIVVGKPRKGSKTPKQPWSKQKGAKKKILMKKKAKKILVFDYSNVKAKGMNCKEKEEKESKTNSVEYHYKSSNLFGCLFFQQWDPGGHLSIHLEDKVKV